LAHTVGRGRFCTRRVGRYGQEERVGSLGEKRPRGVAETLLGQVVVDISMEKMAVIGFVGDDGSLGGMAEELWSDNRGGGILTRRRRRLGYRLGLRLGNEKRLRGWGRTRIGWYSGRERSVLGWDGGRASHRDFGLGHGKGRMAGMRGEFRLLGNG
jgi:hypothetical protein